MRTFVSHTVTFLLDKGEGDIVKTATGYGEVSGVTVHLPDSRDPQISVSARRCRKDGSDDKRMGNVLTGATIDAEPWVEKALQLVRDDSGERMTMPDADDATLQERIWDSSVNVERIVHLGVQLVGEYLDDELTEWLLDDTAEVLAAALGVTVEEFGQDLNRYGTGRDQRQEAMQESLRSLTGWLVQVSAPRIDWSEDGKSGSVHMGWRRLHVAYADTYDEALEAAVTWGENFTAPPGAVVS